MKKITTPNAVQAATESQNEKGLSLREAGHMLT